MKTQHFAVALALAMLGIAYNAARVHVAPTSEEAAFQAFLSEFEQGTTGFINGDAAGWKARVSRRADATLMGGWGIVARGWPEVGSRYDWAARRFADSGATLKVEYVSTTVSGDLAYTVAIERSEVRLADQTARSPMALRVTHVFRKEDGLWKLVHRHADPILETTAPAAVLAR
jgi:ketosteroid isomerase-like protein